MFEKLIVYRKVITVFKEQHGIFDLGFPFDTFHSYYSYYGNLGMLGYFLKFVQQYNFLIVSNNKSIIVVDNGKIVYNKEVDINPYDLTSRHWFGILICCAFLEKRL